MNLRSLGLLPAALIVCAPLAQADKTTPTPEVQTRAALKRLGTLYGPAWTLTYESVLTTKTYGPASGTQATEATVHGVLQKPNKFRLEVMQHDKLIGLLVSNGDTVYIYSPQEATYRRQNAPPDLALGVLTLPDKALARVAVQIPVMAMTPTLFSLATRPDFLGTDATGFSTNPLTLHGRQALDCSWTEDGATEHILFNQATGLPLRTIDSSTDKDGTTTERQEDLTAIQVGDVPLPLTAFDWTPPTDAKLIANEAKPAAPTLPAKTTTETPPKTSGVTRRHRRHKTVPDGGAAGNAPSGKIIRPAPSP